MLAKGWGEACIQEGSRAGLRGGQCGARCWRGLELRRQWCGRGCCVCRAGGAPASCPNSKSLRYSWACGAVSWLNKPKLNALMPVPVGVQSVGNATFFQSVVNVINILSGVGLLSLPFALRKSGWAGLGVLWLMGFVTNYTGA